MFIDGTRVRVDGTRGGDKGLGYRDEPNTWGELGRDTDQLPEWTRPYLETVRAWEMVWNRGRRLSAGWWFCPAAEPCVDEH